jgi:hypothetical protein
VAVLCTFNAIRVFISIISSISYFKNFQYSSSIESRTRQNSWSYQCTLHWDYTIRMMSKNLQCNVIRSLMTIFFIMRFSGWFCEQIMKCSASFLFRSKIEFDSSFLRVDPCSMARDTLNFSEVRLCNDALLKIHRDSYYENWTSI